MYPRSNIKIGLFGGSFNPPHLGHIYLSNYAIKSLKLDLLIFIPSYKSVDKEELEYLDPEDRYNMLRISKPKNTYISTYELRSKRPLQSIETVRYFRSIFPNFELYFLVGEDHSNSLSNWDDISELINKVHLTIFRRGGNLHLEFPDSFTTAQKNQIIVLDNERYNFSSTYFRVFKKFKILHKKVSKYIKLHGLDLHWK